MPQATTPNAAPEPYTAQPGGRYLIQADGQRVRLDDTASDAPLAPAPAPAKTIAPATKE